MNEIRRKLDELARLKAKQTTMAEPHRAKIDAMMEPFREQIKAIEATIADKSAELSVEIAMLEDEIKAATIEYGESIKGTFLRAQYSRGRVSWNTKGLVGYGAAHPEVLQFRKQGKPYVSIRGA